MKKVLIGIIFISLVSCHERQVQSQPLASSFPTATQWNKGVVGWNLGNQLECPALGTKNESTLITCLEGSINAETAWGNPKVTEKTIKAVKDAGFNAIRIPVRWQCHIVNEQAMTVDKAWMQRVKEVVDWCLNQDLKVILNTHHEKWLDSRPTYAYKDENCRKFAFLWIQIASEFKDYDSRLAFAGTNEVHIRDNWGKPTAENLEVQNAYNQTFVDAVRSTGGNNICRNLIVQTYVCNPRYGFDGAFIVPLDLKENGNQYMSVEFHFYSPWEYAGQGTLDIWVDDGRFKRMFDRVQKEWGSQGLGITIGEWGVTNHGNASNADQVHENITYYCKTYVSEAMKHGFSTFVWDNNSFGQGADRFGIFNRFKGMKLEAPWMLRGIMEGIDSANNQ